MRTIVRAIAVAVMMTGLTLSAAGCAVNTPPQTTNPTNSPTTDPRSEWVLVNKGANNYSSIYKRCDGSTLLYQHGGGLAAVPNSPECTDTSTP